MSGEPPERLRVALIHHSYGAPGAADAPIRTLAAALRTAGHEPRVIGSRAGVTRRFEEDGVPVVLLGRLAERRLRARALDSPVTHLPALSAELERERFDVAHAFSPQDAAVAGLGPHGVVFTCVEAPARSTLAARRFRLWFWERAVDPGQTVLAAGEEQREALRRWLAVEAEVVDPGDAGAHERVYRAARERSVA